MAEKDGWTRQGNHSLPGGIEETRNRRSSDGGDLEALDVVASVASIRPPCRVNVAQG